MTVFGFLFAVGFFAAFMAAILFTDGAPSGGLFARRATRRVLARARRTPPRGGHDQR